MNLYSLRPDVPGQWGPNTRLSPHAGTGADQAVPKVDHLHLHLDAWDGDDLVTTYPCFVVTQKLATEIDSSDLSGASFEEVEITTSDVFDELYSGVEVPPLVRLVPSGRVTVDQEGSVRQWSEDDFCDISSVIVDNALPKRYVPRLPAGGALVVSNKALDILNRFSLVSCQVEELSFSL